MYRVGFVILTWNSEKYIRECLSSVNALEQDAFQCDIVVIDNGSADGTRAILQEFAAHTETFAWIALEKNLGTTCSRNLGIKTLLSKSQKPDFICILDSDTVICTEAFQTMCRYVSNDPICGILGPKLHNKDGMYQISGRNIPTLSEKLCKVLPIVSLQEKGIQMQASIPLEGNGCVEVGYLMSACWLVRTEVVEEIGLLDEDIFYAPEDLEYCIRCWKAGYKVMYCYDAEIVHLWQRISRQKLFSKHNWEHIRGLIHVFLKYRYWFRTKKLWVSFHDAVARREKRLQGE